MDNIPISTPAVLSRRSFLLGSAAALGACALGPGGVPGASRLSHVSFTSDPFTLGVASGYPLPGGVVLWTRLAPDAPSDAAAIESAAVEVRWQVAEDDAFRRVVAEGTAIADPDFVHAVHVEATNLQPARDYWYRFESGGATSPVGRTRTAPAIGARLTRGRLAFASCAHYEQGFFTAYRDMADRNLDLIVHVGDYIYESSWGDRPVRRHDGPIPTTLDQFRRRYTLYKRDPDLRAAHAASPWLAMWDDHEVANDYTDDISVRTRDPAQFLPIRAAAYRAWYEHMPVPAAFRPRGPDARIYCHYAFGDLFDLTLLDARQYRSHHACLPGASASTLVDCPDRNAATRTMLGTQQEAWFADRMRQSGARWSIVAQTTLMAERDRAAGANHAFWMDGWDGYTASRGRVLDAIAAHPRSSAIVVGGDVHAFWAADLRRDFSDPRSPVVATEFVGGAITSQGPSRAAISASLDRNPHLRYGRADRRGYGVLTIEPDGCGVEFRGVDDEKVRGSPVRTLARFSIASGAPGVHVDSVAAT